MDSIKTVPFIPFGTIECLQGGVFVTKRIEVILLDQYGRPMAPPEGFNLQSAAFQRVVTKAATLAKEIIEQEQKGVQRGEPKEITHLTQQAVVYQNNIVARYTHQNSLALWSSLEQTILGYFKRPERAESTPITAPIVLGHRANSSPFSFVLEPDEDGDNEELFAINPNTKSSPQREASRALVRSAQLPDGDKEYIELLEVPQPSLVLV